MIDAPGREIPRFPPELECEAAKSISRRIGYARQAAGGSVVGIASGARGGDILFLEACRKEGLSLRMVLPFAAGTVFGYLSARHCFWRLGSPVFRALE